jgi:RNAse (barnase) inhibitor barstar
MITWSEVSRPSGPWVHRTQPENLPSILQLAGSADVRLIQLDGARMHTLEELFREYVREFSFPEYFGWNWAAFDECMKGLNDQPARAYLTVITRADQILSAEPDELATFLRQLEDVGRRWGGAFGLGVEWGNGEVPFHTILGEEHD